MASSCFPTMRTPNIIYRSVVAVVDAVLPFFPINFQFGCGRTFIWSKYFCFYNVILVMPFVSLCVCVCVLRWMASAHSIFLFHRWQRLLRSNWLSPLIYKHSICIHSMLHVCWELAWLRDEQIDGASVPIIANLCSRSNHSSDDILLLEPLTWSLAGHEWNAQ